MSAIPWTFATGGGAVAEQLEWLTDELAARTGPAQTRRLREFPVTSLKFDGMERGESRARLETTLWNNGAGRWLVPLVMDARQLQVAVAIEDDALVVPTDGVRFVAGGKLLLQGVDPSVHEVATIATVGDGFVTIQDGVASAWPAGTQVTPLREGWLQQSPQLARFTSDQTDVYQAQFYLAEALESEPDLGEVEYRGHPVLTWAPEWSRDPTWTPERSVGMIDGGVSPPVQVDLVGAPRPVVVLQYTLRGMQQVQAFRGLLFGLAGRWRPIWVPSWVPELWLSQSVSVNSGLIHVRGPSASLFPLHPTRRDIRIELRSGLVLYRRITQVQAISPTVDRLYLDVNIPLAIALADVVAISYMTLSRQRSDVNVLRYFDWQTVECELTFKAEIHGI